MTASTVSRVLVVWLAAFGLIPLAADEPAAFRTDGGDESLPWFELVGGQFPPPGSAHAISGELIGMDHLERTFQLRVDRNDNQRRSHFDLPIAATMLPYGSLHYHGAAASIRDIPIGTHLHGLFYVKAADDDSQPPAIFHNRVSTEADFNRCFRLEDDFSYRSRRNELWEIKDVDLEGMKLEARLTGENVENAEPQTFDLLASTTVWKANGFGNLDDLGPGQRVLLNRTWATLYGPGRITDLWIDETSRRLARERQLRKHLDHIRQRGLPGWVDEVDNQNRIVTITLFDNVAGQLIEELHENDIAGVAVARESLMTYDPVNDRKRGKVLEVREVDRAPGSSGVQLRVQPDLLLEGYRPGRIVRVYPSAWKVISLPREEEFFGR
jgi:hypothetical protein